MDFVRRNAIALLALFVALGGSAGAVVKLAPSTVTSREIKDRSVRLVDIAPAALKTLRGARGRRGLAGTAGSTGATGAQGLAGGSGATGLPGAQGPGGGSGAPGLPGAPGPADSVTRFASQQQLIYDDFAGASGRLGTPENGEPWRVTGPSADSARIADGAFVSDGVAYAGVKAARAVSTIGGRFRLGSGPRGAAKQPMAIMLSGDPTFGLARILHLVFDREGARLTWWKPGYADQPMSSGVTNLAFSFPLEIGQEHSVTMTVRESNVGVEFSNGAALNASDPNVPDVVGPLCVWQLLSDGPETSNNQWTAVAAMGAST